jgi:hypothetical protein
MEIKAGHIYTLNGISVIVTMVSENFAGVMEVITQTRLITPIASLS